MCFLGSMASVPARAVEGRPPGGTEKPILETIIDVLWSGGGDLFLATTKPYLLFYSRPWRHPIPVCRFPLPLIPDPKSLLKAGSKAARVLVLLSAPSKTNMDEKSGQHWVTQGIAPDFCSVTVFLPAINKGMTFLHRP